MHCCMRIFLLKEAIRLAKALGTEQKIWPKLECRLLNLPTELCDSKVLQAEHRIVAPKVSLLVICEGHFRCLGCRTKLTTCDARTFTTGSASSSGQKKTKDRHSGSSGCCTDLFWTMLTTAGVGQHFFTLTFHFSGLQCESALEFDASPGTGQKRGLVREPQYYATLNSC